MQCTRNILSREFISAFECTETEIRGLILCSAPATIKGTAFLAIQSLDAQTASEPEVHIYLPALKATKKISRSMSAQKQFFGSEFTLGRYHAEIDDSAKGQMDPLDSVSRQACGISRIYSPRRARIFARSDSCISIVKPITPIVWTASVAELNW